jgi:hypothetical protein
LPKAWSLLLDSKQTLPRFHGYTFVGVGGPRCYGKVALPSLLCAFNAREWPAWHIWTK